MNFTNIQTKVNQTVSAVVNNDQVRQFVMFIITAVAVIVGVAQFVSRSWVQNDMNSKVRNVAYTVLTYVYNMSHKFAMLIEEKEVAVWQLRNWSGGVDFPPDPFYCTQVPEKCI